MSRPTKADLQKRIKHLEQCLQAADSERQDAQRVSEDVREIARESEFNRGKAAGLRAALMIVFGREDNDEIPF